MKRYKFEKKSLHVSQDLLDKMTDACLSLPKITRATLAEKAGVSLVTAGKFLTATADCKFTHKKLHYTEGERKASYRHVLNEALSILVIDLSSPRFSMSIIRGGSECRFFEYHDYIPDISFSDNLSLFLSRSGASAVKQPFGISAICAVISDEGMPACRSAVSVATKEKLSEIEDTIARFFGAMPILCTEQSNAIALALKYGKIKAPSNTRSAHIYVGKGISLSVYKGNSLLCVLNPKGLIVNGIETLCELHEKMRSEEDLGKILYRLVNLADCTFSPETYIVEYDTVKFGSTALKHIKRAFAAVGKQEPEISSICRTPSLAAFGAAYLSAARLIRLHITAEVE